MEGFRPKPTNKTQIELPKLSETLFLNGLKWLKTKYGTINKEAFSDVHSNLYMLEYQTEDEVKRAVQLINDFTGENTATYYLNDKMHKGPRYMLQLISEQQKLAA